MLSMLLLLAQLTLHLRPFGYLNSPATTEAIVSINSANARIIDVEVVGEYYYSHSSRELNEKSAKIQRFKFVNLREGRYEVYASLTLWEDGHWKVVHTKAPETLEIH